MRDISARNTPFNDTHTVIIGHYLHIYRVELFYVMKYYQHINIVLTGLCWWNTNKFPYVEVNSNYNNLLTFRRVESTHFDV